MNTDKKWAMLNDVREVPGPRQPQGRGNLAPEESFVISHEGLAKKEGMPQG